MKTKDILALNSAALEEMLNAFIPSLEGYKKIANELVDKAQKEGVEIDLSYIKDTKLEHDKIKEIIEKASEFQLNGFITDLLCEQLQSLEIGSIEKEFDTIKQNNNTKKKELKELTLDLIEEAKKLNIAIPQLLNEQQIKKTPSIGIMPGTIVPEIKKFVKQFSTSKVESLALDREFPEQKDKLDAIISDINNGKLPTHRYKELLYQNLYEEEKLYKKGDGSVVELKSSRTFLAYALPKINDIDDLLNKLKSNIGDAQFSLYMQAPILLEGKEDPVTIETLYFVKHGDLNKEYDALDESKKQILRKHLPSKKIDGKTDEKKVEFKDIDTHNISSHKSADESHVGAFKMMLETNGDLKSINATYSGFHKEGELPRKVEVTRNAVLDKFVQKQLRGLQNEIDDFIKTDYSKLYEVHVRISSSRPGYSETKAKEEKDKTNEVKVDEKLDELKKLNVAEVIKASHEAFYEKYIRPDKRAPAYSALPPSQKKEIDNRLDALAALNVALEIDKDRKEFYNSYIRFYLKDPLYHELKPDQKEAVDKNIKGPLFQAGAAKRYMDNMIKDHKCNSGSYPYCTNAAATCGLTMEEMVATCYWASKDREHFKSKDAKDANILFAIIRQLYDMRRGYNIQDDHSDNPDENIFPENPGTDKNRCHGGAVNSLADALSSIHASYNIKTVTAQAMEAEVRRIYGEIVSKNLESIKEIKDEEVLRIWSSTGRVTGEVRAKLEAQFKKDYLVNFEALYKGYIADDILQSIIDRGLDNVAMPEELKKKWSIEEMTQKDIYTAIANEMLPLLHLDRNKGYNSTLNYLSGLERHESLALYLINAVLKEYTKNPFSTRGFDIFIPELKDKTLSTQRILVYLSKSNLSQKYKDKVILTIEGKEFTLGDISSLSSKELEFLINAKGLKEILEESIEQSDLSNLFILYERIVGFKEDELANQYGNMLNLAIDKNNVDVVKCPDR